MRWRPVLVTLVAAVLLVIGVGTAVGAFPEVTQPDYTFVMKWGQSGSGDGQLDAPFHLARDKYGTLYIADMDNDRIQVFDADGTFVDAWGTSGSGDGQFSSPYGVAVDLLGYVYVADTFNHRIQVFKSSGEYVDQWGSHGAAPGQLDTPCDVAAGRDGLIYVADSSNHRIQVFTSSGGYVRDFGEEGSNEGQLHSPYGIGLDHDGNVIVADSGNNRIQIFDSKGNMVWRWGASGSGDGEFSNPWDVAVDARGDIFVAEAGNNRVQKFDILGTFITKWGRSGGDGTPGAGDGEFGGAGGAVAGPNREIIVSDITNDRIQVFKANVGTVTDEVAGSTRITTAIDAALKAYPYGADAVVISTGYNWPDALGGAALAGTLDAPLLLTRADALDDSVVAALATLKTKRAYILGGEAALSANVESALKIKLGSSNVVRVAGANRYETAREIAKRVAGLRGAEFAGYAFVSTGMDFPDALASSPAAAAEGWPIYLSDPASISAETLTAMKDAGVERVFLIGGEKAVSPAVESALKAKFGSSAVERIAGTNRYETAAVMAQTSVERAGLTWNYTALATGQNFPDALAGGVLQGSDRTVLLLTESDRLNPYAALAIASNKDGIYELRYLGQTDVVSTAVRTAAKALLIP
jgi:putative cell wall-binding protein